MIGHSILAVTLGRADRRLARFVACSTCVGLVFLGVGIWMLMNPVPELENMSYGGAWFGALVIGVLGIGLPWIEVLRRVRRGDEEPGRHTRV